MIELFLAASEPPKQKLIEYVIEQKVEIPPELTLAEKIASDYYKCEPTRYIRADTAECGAIRPEYRVPEARSTTERTNTPVATQNTATAPAGWFQKGQCTWLVWTKRPVGLWNDASDWLWQAKRDGYTISDTPIAGAIGWEPGHVVYVSAVEGNSVTIIEANYDYHGSIRTISRPANYYTYIY